MRPAWSRCEPVSLAGSTTLKRTATAGRLDRQAVFSRARLLLVAGSGLLFAIPLLVLQPAALWTTDVELFRLLRGMGSLKILLAVIALTVIWWRLGRPVPAGLQAVLIGGVWALSLAAGLIWQMHLVLPASGLFHAATFVLLVAAWRDMPPVRLARSGRGLP